MVNHEILVRGFGLEKTPDQKPVVLAMRDGDFPTRLFADLGEPPARRISTARRAEPGPSGYLHLLQPVQRTLQVAMVDLACDVVGTPRLDPRRVESAGLVVRRVGRAADGQDDFQAHEAWMRSADGRFAWKRLNPSEVDLDPDPTRRPSLNSGQPELDQLLGEHLAKSAYTESVSPAFLTPPVVNDRLSRTVLYGIVPTASGEVSDEPPRLPDLDGGEKLRKQLPPLLTAGAHTVPLKGEQVRYKYMSEDYCESIGKGAFRPFINLMLVVALEFDAFGDSPQSKKLFELFNRGTVSYESYDEEYGTLWTPVGIGTFLANAKHCLLDYDPAGGLPVPELNMPHTWDGWTEATETEILAAAQECVRARSVGLLSPQGRFQDPTRLYRLRMFLRVRGHEGCPPRTVWSEYSAPFEIAPWYESAGLVGPPIPLPNPTRDFLKKVRPNVSFVVPGGLMNAMQATTLKGMTKGELNEPAKIDLAWICGFNIPIITICAFFLLNIFLVVLNLIFWWLPFVKICIPFPKSAAKSMGAQ